MRRICWPRRVVVLVFILTGLCGATTYDVAIVSGVIYDGSGRAPYRGDVGIKDDRIVALGRLVGDAERVIDAQGLAVAPGFINMLSWAGDYLLVDGRSQSDIRQGVTLEVMGEGTSMGPLNDAMKREIAQSRGDLDFEIEWSTLGEYLEYMARRGVSTNIASFVGASTLRAHVLGYGDIRATPEQLQQMRALVGQAMREGAVGVSSALIYAPGSYANTEELIALAREASAHGGMYISHIRSEGNGLLDALDELTSIARAANVRTELYHMKVAGQANWPKLGAMIEKIEKARAEGLAVTANMYTYTAGATGLDAAMPPWVQAGGHGAWVERLRDPAIRKRLLREMTTPTDDWENLMLLAGSPENVLLVGFKNETLKPLTGKTLAEVARLRGTSPAETAMDLVIEDDSEVGTVYFLMSEENVKRQIALPWVSFCSDSGSLAPEGVFLKSNVHPRAYGCFARLLGKYVRQEKVIPLAEAVRRLTSQPAENLKLDRRGRLRKGYYADVVVFDPETIIDRSTYEKPHQYATGMKHVFVNGTQVLKDGEHTGAKPGRVVRGPGWTGRNASKNADTRTTEHLERIPLILDADTANEIDDLYAIVRALLEPRFDVKGLTSAQWRHHLSPKETAIESQKLNEDILRLMGLTAIPHPMGSEMIMGKPWGGYESRKSPATAFMIETARAMPKGQKLSIACLGAVTNLASAVKLAPDIVPRIKCYTMSCQFDPQKKIWNKDEFNCRRDLNAANYLFNTKGLELHIMTATTSRDLRFQQDVVKAKLLGKGGIWDYLAKRWLTFSPNSKTWIFWDLALIEAMVRPELAKEETFLAPPENTQRLIHVYTDIDQEAMEADWWRVVREARDK